MSQVEVHPISQAVTIRRLFMFMKQNISSFNLPDNFRHQFHGSFISTNHSNWSSMYFSTYAGLTLSLAPDNDKTTLLRTLYHVREILQTILLERCWSEVEPSRQSVSLLSPNRRKLQTCAGTQSRISLSRPNCPTGNICKLRSRGSTLSTQ